MVLNYAKIFVYETVTDSVEAVPMRVNCISRVLDQIMVEMFMFSLVSPDRCYNSTLKWVISPLSYSSCFVTYAITHSMLHTINCYQTMIKQFSKQITSDNHITQLLQYGMCYASAPRPSFSHIFCSWSMVCIVLSSFCKFANWLLELRIVCSTLFCY